MSQTVIERLERQVNEYQFELEQAKDTIERQHDMYYSLLRSTDSKNSVVVMEEQKPATE
jgi:hypothetical protein